MSEERTDYRKATPEVLYQMRKTVVSMYRKKKPVEEMIEITGLCERTARIMPDQMSIAPRRRNRQYEGR